MKRVRVQSGIGIIMFSAFVGLASAMATASTYLPLGNNVEHVYNGVPFELWGVWLDTFHIRPLVVDEDGAPILDEDGSLQFEVEFNPMAWLDLSPYGMAKTLHIIQYCAWADNVPDGVPAGHITVYYQDGSTSNLSLIVGENTAEWAYDHPGGQAAGCLQHSRVEPAYSSPPDDPVYEYDGHLYYVWIPLRPVPLDRIELAIDPASYAQNTYCSQGDWFGVTINGLTIEYHPSIPATMAIEPGTLNLDSQGKWITAYLSLPEGYDVADIDPESLWLNNKVQAAASWIDEETLEFVVRFDYAEVVEILKTGEVPITVTGLVAGDARFEGTDTVRCFGEGSPPANPQAALAGHWKLDEEEGSTARDSSRNNNHGTLYGDPTWMPDAGVVGGALWLDGDDDYVSLPIGSLIGQLTNCTIMTWAYWDGKHSWQRIFDFGSGTEVNMFLTPMTGEGTGSTAPYELRFAMTTGGGGAEERVSAGTLDRGEWYHIAVTIDGDNGIITLYLSGTPVAQNAGATLAPRDLGTTTQNWLGRSQYRWDRYYEGALDDFRIYSRALSPGEIRTVLRESD